ncbi:restriction endonuclease subunit S [Burkholderia thailandensis]|uniref:restriction endonuclease subunit S n=1 Tax=Burkholderia thailandensis TaxID=57975 RepID=UPI00217D6FAE|nr:restriction endonuclease subunit S [Burkholderia thailandensis]MCS6500755.1 restriction endonuclease subunit S [Burkholderia thailandensis]
MTHTKMFRLEEVATFMGGSTPSRANPAFFGGGIPWVKTTDLNNGLIVRTEETLTELGLSTSSCKIVPPGAVLVAMYGGFNQIGRTGLLSMPSAINQALTAVLPDRTKLDPNFLIEWLNFRVDYWKRFAGSSRKDPNITKGDIADFPVPSIPVELQQTYVGILGEWNAAIEQTERMIAAKVQRHRGLMLRLLRGTAFPVQKLSDFVERVGRKNTTGNDHPLTISGKDGLIPQHRFFDKRIAAEATENYTLLKRGEFAYNKSYSSGYPYGAIKRLDSCDEGIVSSLYLCFALKEPAKLLSEYLAYFCEAGGFNGQIHQIAQEGARNHGLLNVAVDDFFAMKLPVPNIAHQQRVAAVLAESDLELGNLRKLLDATRLQKRGLMQKLLTREWRLQVLEEASA